MYRLGKVIVGFGTLCSILMLPTGAGGESARSLGMAGSFRGNDGTCESALLNPANLGRQHNNRWSVQLLSASVQAENNAFSISDYNRYNGAYLTTADKEDILGKVPSSGLDLQLKGQAGAFSASYRGFAFSTEVIGGGRGWLAKGPLELALMGNSIGQSVNAEGTDGDGWAAVAFGVSHGRLLVDIPDFKLSGGLTVKYLRGLSYYGIEDLAAAAVTEITGINGSGGLTSHEATGGSGYAVDLGWSANYRQTDFSLLVSNLFAKINWTRGTTERVYNFTISELTAENASEDTAWSSDEIVIPEAAFSSRPPIQLELSASRQIGEFLTSASVAQGFEDTPFTSASPRLAVGAEYEALNWLALRSGVAGGGNEKISLALGLGFATGPWRFDIGYAAASRLLPWGGTGGTLAISSYLDF